VVTGDHIRQRLAEALELRVMNAFHSRGLFIDVNDVEHVASYLAEGGVPVVGDLIADELDAAAEQWDQRTTTGVIRLWVVDDLRARAAAVRARTEETMT
jgi:hypothetical protein